MWGTTRVDRKGSSISTVGFTVITVSVGVVAIDCCTVTGLLVSAGLAAVVVAGLTVLVQWAVSTLDGVA